MLLVLSNAQSELTPLEIGIHALEAVTLGIGGREKGGLSEYARQIGKGRTYVTQVRQAAEVLAAVKPFSQLNGLLDKAQHLNAVHLSPTDTWPLLVEHLLANDWTVDDTEKAVKRVKDLLSAIPGWWIVDRQSILEWDEPDAETCVPLSGDCHHYCHHSHGGRKNIECYGVDGRHEKTRIYRAFSFFIALYVLSYRTPFSDYESAALTS